ncbi:MAG: hypothetical protein ACXWLT_07980 [Rhizomicrobium sp.]
MRESSASSDFAAVAFVAGAGLAAFSPQIFHDGDTWWHLAAGNWMLAHHAVPAHDIFSYTFAGAPWNAHEWLSEILMAGAFGAAGWSGLHILFALAFGATAAIAGRALRRQMDLIPALITTVLGLACVVGSLLARPHILALPLLAFWTAALVEARQQKRAPPLWLAGLMLPWANLHGTFAFGLALAAALGLEVVIEKPGRGALKHWGPFIGASLVAACLTPQGLNGLLFPIKLLAMPGIGVIGEWAPSDITHLTPFLLALLAMFFILVTGKVTVPAPRAVLILALTYLALAHGRHEMLFGVAAPILAAPAMGNAWPPREERGRLWLVPGMACVLALMVLARLAWPAIRGDDRTAPVTALAHVPPALRAKPVLNAYEFGGYLIFQGVRDFIDSRADMYPADFLEKDFRLSGGDANLLAATLAHYRIAWTIFPSGSPVAVTLDHSPGWRRLYGDTNAVVHVRD